MVDAKTRTEIVNEVLKDESNLGLDMQSKLNKVLKFMKADNTNNYLDELPEFDSITKLDIYCDTISGFTADGI